MSENDTTTFDCDVCGETIDDPAPTGWLTFSPRVIYDLCSPRCTTELLEDEYLWRADLNMRWEDGYRPPDDPDQWQHLYNFSTDEPCPDCGCPINLILGHGDTLLETVMNLRICPDGWTRGYDQPVYLGCVGCEWYTGAEWERVRTELENGGIAKREGSH